MIAGYEANGSSNMQCCRIRGGGHFADCIEAVREAARAETVDHGLAETLNALADCVTKATEFGHDEDDWIMSYLLPVGPLHRAIPLLARYGIHVRPGGVDSRTRG